jgi:hypothetical protein
MLEGSADRLMAGALIAAFTIPFMFLPCTMSTTQ